MSTHASERNCPSRPIHSRIKVKETREDKFIIKKGRPQVHFYFGPRRKRCVYDHTEVTTTYEDRMRDVITDYDKRVHYGEWVVIKTYTEITKVDKNNNPK